MVNARPHDPDATKALNINVLPGFANSCGEPKMKTLTVVIALSFTAQAAQFSITPKNPPVVFQGGSVKFSANRSVEWSLMPGSQGSIDPDGTYHAPARIKAKQSVSGCQVLPNNHVINARIDSLPVHPKSAMWMHAVDKDGRPLTGGQLRFNYSFPINAVDSHAPQQQMVFAYSPSANGMFRTLPAADFKMEGGFYSEPFSGVDRHSIFVESDTCTFQEMYNFYPVGTNTYDNCPDCTSQSGVRYSGYSYALPPVATDAASLYLTALALHRDEVLSGSIEHALRVTLLGSFIQSSHVWPAIAEAGYNHGDFPPFGTRFRLRSDFVVQSRNPVVQTFVTQLQRYGLILADIGGQWEMDAADTDVYFDREIRAAVQELGRLVLPSNLEAVDESRLMFNATSGDTPIGAETVVAKDKSGKTETIRVVLVGVTIGVESQLLVFQAGAPSHRVKAWVNGSSDHGVLWSMTPSAGLLSGDGVYTPPPHLENKQELMLIAKAHADQQVLTSIKVTLLPNGPIRIDNGNTSSYTDSNGHAWLPQCCTPQSAIYSYPGPWPNTKDIKLYQDDTVSWSDIPFLFFIPPGKYRITLKEAEASYMAPNIREMHFEAQGQLIYRDVDLFAQSGAKNPSDFDLPAVVGSDGKLSLNIRHVRGEQSLVGAIQIVPDAGAPHLHMSPANGGTLSISQTRQFYSVPWYLSNQAVTWTISPKIGSIDTHGLYIAPANQLPHDTTVTVTAASVADPSLQANSVLILKQGILAIRVNCGGDQFTDVQKNVWAGDYGFKGGVKYDEPAPIAGAPADMQKLYQSSRYGYGTDSFSYSFPLPNGEYSVKLKWAEYRTAAEVAAQHMLYKMRVVINGTQMLNNFDPTAAAGGVAKAYDKTFHVTVKTGDIHIVFTGLPGAGYVGSAIGGIEIEPTLGGSDVHQ
jgi:hypothetical protein